MKKFTIFTSIFALFVAIALVSAPVYANGPADKSDSFAYVYGAHSDYAEDYTGGPMSGHNDDAWAGGNSGYEGESGGQGNGVFFSFSKNAVEGKAKTKAFACAADFGKTSVAGALVGTKTTVFGGGVSGPFGSNYTILSVDGAVEQANYAAEDWQFKKPNDYAMGGNYSRSTFEGTAENYDNGFMPATGAYLTGSALVGGGTVVTIDNTGRKQSAKGITGNFAVNSVCGCPGVNATGTVFGEGFMYTGIQVQTKAAIAGANTGSSFMYTGSNSGMGVAGGVSKAKVTSHSASSSAKSFSFTRSDAGSGGAPD